MQGVGARQEVMLGGRGELLSIKHEAVTRDSYERGILFWADMDSRIRAASNGRRSLDNVMIPLVKRARSLGGDGESR